MNPPSIIQRIFLFGLVLGSLALAGCQTMEGAGEDIEKAGEEIQDAAK